MLFKDNIDLITFSETINTIGDVVKTPSYKSVYANRKSIRQSEFYQAFATGFKPELMFEIRFYDYSNESKIRWNNHTYDVLRTFTKNEEMIELICQGVVNNAIT
jgi:SPP1 family predicted phage head-tail adaptor